MTRFLPEISPILQAFIRTGYGLLMCLTLVWAWPHRRRFFLSERWGGYGESRPSVEWLQNPGAVPVVFTVWFASCLCLTFGVWVVPAALTNFLLCRYYFVSMRWKGLLRGMGAPGFMAYWLGAVVLLLEFTIRYAPRLHPVALFTAQFDFALIMASAGIYKFTSGYAENQGMDFAMANPQWGYWWRFFRNVSPQHWMFPVLNHAAWATEIVAAVLMMIPQTRPVGGLVITVSFLFIFTQIRLAWLGEMVMLCGFLLVPPGHLVDRWVVSMFSAPPVEVTPSPEWLTGLLALALWGYVAFLPLAHGGLFYNYYARRRFSEPLQNLLERYTNFFGIIIWRVFSVDHLNFFIRIYQEKRDGAERQLVARYGSWRSLRFSHVAECIVVTSVFTTLKYYASNRLLFETRLKRYARTVPCPIDCVLVLQYVWVRKQSGRYEHVPAVEYAFDPVNQSLSTVQLESGFDVHAADHGSILHEGVVPGSYAPAAH